MTAIVIASLVDLDPADLEFEPVSGSHGRTFYKDNLMGLLHESPQCGVARYSWTAERIAGVLARFAIPGLTNALDRITAEGWRPTGLFYPSNERISIRLQHLESRWGVQVGINLDRGAELVFRSSLKQDDPACGWKL